MWGKPLGVNRSWKQPRWHANGAGKVAQTRVFSALWGAVFFFNIITSCASHQWSKRRPPLCLSERGSQVKNTNRSDMTHGELLLHLRRTAMDEDSWNKAQLRGMIKAPAVFFLAREIKTVLKDDGNSSEVRVEGWVAATTNYVSARRRISLAQVVRSKEEWCHTSYSQLAILYLLSIIPVRLVPPWCS